MSDKFERVVEISAAFDKRNPDPSKNYGLHGCDLLMLLKGPLGAVQFLLFTGWQLPHVQEEFDQKPLNEVAPLIMGKRKHLLCHPMPADLGYHWHKPRYEGQQSMRCKYLEEGRCYYDGSTLNAERIYKVLLEEGSDGVWRELERYYTSLSQEDET